ncbi:hypothetical protein BDC45DRAFT_570301 [Circinella umbellata]|nr:hypothetical protein BDC45DRAFT_570301 [Circinella umbellata]
MLSSILYLFSIFCIFCNLAIAAPLRLQQQQQQDQDDWPLSNAVMIRDTIEGFYETVVDDVLSAHTEDLLVMLTHSPRNKKLKLLQAQATTLRDGSSLQDACLAKMPGYIGNQLHQLNARVFGAIRGIVGEALPAVWPNYDALEATMMSTEAPPPVPQHQVATALYSLNLAVGHRLTQVFEDFDLLDRLRNDLSACDQSIADSIQEDTTITTITTTSTMTTTKMTMTDYIVNAGHRFIHRLFWTRGCGKFDNDTRFLETWLRSARADLRSELETRVGDLIMTIYNDLYNEENAHDF